MKQRIVHGATMDVATPGEVAEIIEKAFARKPDKHYHSEKGSIILDATGAGQMEFRLPRLFGWVMERVTITTAPAGVATVQFFENQIAGTDMREYVPVPASGLYSDSFDNRLYLAPGTRLFVVCSAGPVSGQLQFNLQIELVEAQLG